MILLKNKIWEVLLAFFSSFENPFENPQLY